ncbi:MAG: tetratricopeptide repeat protein [Clostridia bacterium]|nr:tetratricopeptide repeat protein [Clostridia bacterium]
MQNEKTIRIFIGSSITDLELERMKLMSFIQGLNNKYHERGIFIEGYICEETPNNMRLGGSQVMHNDYISGSADATIFMFFHKAGEFTMKELELARQAFLEKGKPNVYVFFKAVDGAPDINEDIQRAVSLVFDDYGHYYKMFDDVDTVKLELLQFLMDKLNGKGELVIKDGAVYMNGELIKDISAANIFAYQNNPNLKSLKEQIEELEGLLHEANEEGDDGTALRLSKKLDELKKQYAELEADILDTLIFFFEQNKKGGKADKVLAKALRYLELGKIEMAKALIPQEELDRMAESIKKRRALMEAQLRDEEETLLSRTRARIKTLKLDLDNPNRFSEIEHAYESAYEAAKSIKDYDFIYDYADFLYDQKNYPKAIGIAEELKYIYDAPKLKGEITDFERGRLLNLLGLLYDDNKNLQNVEALLFESLALRQSIFKSDSTPDNEANLATTCNNLGSFYAKNDRPQEAEKLFLEALGINRRLAETVSRERYEPDVAGTCNNLGNSYSQLGRPQEAEKLYLEALEISRRLASTISREAYEPDVAMTYVCLGNLYSQFGRPQEAEKLYLEAFGIYKRLASTVSRERYEPDVAMTCNNLGLFYSKNGRPQEAEKLLLEALEISRRLAETVSREAYEPDVADTCNNLGNLYKNNGKPQEAGKLYLEAFGIYKRLASTVSRERYEPNVAGACNNLGIFYAQNGRPQEAEKLYLEALEIRRRLASTVSLEAYEPDVATTCNNLGNFYKDNGRPQEAEKLYLEALEIRKRLAETVSRERYEPDVAMTLFNMGIFYKAEGDAEKSEACFAEAKSIAERYKDVAPICRQIYDRLS